MRALRRELISAGKRIRELEQVTTSLTVGLAAVRSDLERAASSRAWRWGHGTSTLLRQLAGRRVMTQGALARALERIDRIQQANAIHLPPAAASHEERSIAPDHDPAAIARAEGPLRAELAQDLRERLGPAPELDRWPTVSAIVLCHEGHDQLRRLLGGIARHTDYPALDLTVVDNGSPTPIEPLLGQGDVSGAQVLRSDENRAFARANNEAAATVAGDVLLFLNDDVEPFESGWLKELIAAVMADGVGAAGSTLIHVAHDPQRTASGWMIQHRGIRFRLEDHLPRAFNVDQGADLLDDEFGTDQRCPAVTAAAIAIRRHAFNQVGGFSDEYRFGTEDVDLGLKLISAGWDVRCAGRSIAFHRESTTQAVRSRVEVRDDRVRNRQVFHERWAPQLRRELRAARLSGDRYWTSERAHFGITLTSLDPSQGWGDWYTAHELGDALGAIGVRVTYVAVNDQDWSAAPADLDALVTLVDRFDVRRVHPSATVVAWVRNWVHRWLERPWSDRVNVWLASSQGIAQVLEREAGFASERFPLATNPQRFTLGESESERDLDYVLTANRWGAERQIETAIQPRADERFAIFGRGWSQIPELARYHRGELGYDQLAGLYRTARLVLDDTAGPTLPYGALNARVFDALASGALVATNCAAGAHELFDQEFPVWSTREDLRGLLDGLLADERRRTTLVNRYRKTVLEAHTYERRAHQMVSAIGEHHRRLGFVIRIAAPDLERATRWGDLHFARALKAELGRRGHACLIQTRSEWEQLEGCAYDVSVTLRGISSHRPTPGQLNVLWSISHPEALTGVECAGYDLVAVASRAHAETLAALTSAPVFVLEQATDHRLFWPDPDPALAHDVVFVGNSRGVRRPALDWLLPTDRDVAVWGSDWDGLIDKRYLVGDYIRNDELRHVYASAKLILADHWPDMRKHGYISNRVYDALACGTMVICDFVPGIEEQLGPAVAVYRTPEELHTTIETLLADDEQRRARAEAGRRIVVDAHTFERRVDLLLARVCARWEELGHRMWVTDR